MRGRRATPVAQLEVDGAAAVKILRVVIAVEDDDGEEKGSHDHDGTW